MEMSLDYEKLQELYQRAKEDKLSEEDYILIDQIALLLEKISNS
jgi:hypothetical protein